MVPKMTPALLALSFLLMTDRAIAEQLQEVSPPGSRTTLTTGNIAYLFPFAVPSADDVLQALPIAQIARQNPRITCELMTYTVDGPRFYPLVGPARLSRTHFKCTVVSDRGEEIVYIDHDQLVRAD